MSNLQQVIELEARRFAVSVVKALRSASLEELVSITQRVQRPRNTPSKPSVSAPKLRRARLGRRSASDIERTLEQIVAVLTLHPEGLRSEQIQAALQLDRRELPKPLAQGVSSGRVLKAGQKRATTYKLGAEGEAAAADLAEGPPKRAKARAGAGGKAKKARARARKRS